MWFSCLSPGWSVGISWSWWNWRDFFKGVQLHSLVLLNCVQGSICDQPGKNPLKYSVTVGNWTRTTGSSPTELSICGVSNRKYRENAEFMYSIESGSVWGWVTWWSERWGNCLHNSLYSFYGARTGCWFILLLFFYLLCTQTSSGFSHAASLKNRVSDRQTKPQCIRTEFSIQTR